MKSNAALLLERIIEWTGALRLALGRHYFA